MAKRASSSAGSKTRNSTKAAPAENDPKKEVKKAVKRKQEPDEVVPVKSKKPSKEIPESEDSAKSVKNGEDKKLSTTGDFIEKIIQKRAAVCESVAKFKFNKKRVRVITDMEEFSLSSNGVLYWMSRDQRVQDNWAFLYAQRLALKLEAPLHVCFCLVPTFLEATIRQFGFMMKGLAEVEKECRDLNIPFHLLLRVASTSVPNFVKENNIGGIVTDFSPLRTPLKWLDDLKKALPKDVPLCQVDAHNLVPCWVASPKLEYAARTIRTKIHNQLEGFLTDFPPLVQHPHPPDKMPSVTDWKAADEFLKVDRTVQEVSWAKPGSIHGLRMLEDFCENRLKNFATHRNDPNKKALSNLSPWLHFGQISAQRCILTVKQYQGRHKDSVNAFIEETVIRRELADNFCFYNENYDSIKGTYDWAQKTLEAHRGDKRQYLYSRKDLELAKTHDNLWNAAQIQMVTEGKMHGFLRMYWAKKILEWTKSPEEALVEAIYLNDRYNLDGRDPNGFVGCMWSVCGVHDQGWMERPVFGKIRYMNYEGCKRKFDVIAFCTRYRKLKA
ncbi:unnamed protein product [Candidula unifasciata]|uniref:Deoxyribodipyrimidine photo-lyase n=1 Tax=Candidula unifasciata TaxID=100452 RepID=A0A8S3YRK1_9EUPU|nr:unnamed protein product [Candidula unifasciata]